MNPRLATSMFACVAAALAAVLPSPVVGDQRDTTTGYRGDGTGLFPSDCDPVTTWNEWELKVEKDGRKSRLVPIRRDEKNIVWRTPLEQWCNGGMIVVGGKLYLMIDRGGFGYATKLKPDFLGAMLVCMDPADGKILWKRDLNHLDKLPPDRAREAEKNLREANAWYPEAYAAFLAYRRVASPFVGGGHGIKPIENPTEEDEQRYRKAAEAFRAVWPGVPTTIASLRKQFDKRSARMLTWNYSQLAFGNFLKTYFRERLQQREALASVGYTWNAWYGMNSFVGSAMPTPVSDGEHIYVNTGYNDVFCYSLDGERRWCTWFGEQRPSWGAYLTSPVLVGNVLIIHGGQGQHATVWWRGVSKATGELLWEQKDYPQGKSYHMITPVPLDLPVGESGNTMPVVWTGAGNVFRVSDGKLLAQRIGCHGNGRHVGVSREHRVIVMVNGSSDGGAGQTFDYPKGTVAVQLTAESEDEVKAKILWSDAGGPTRNVVRGNVVYGFAGRKGEEFQARDLMTGKLLGKAKVTANDVPHHLSAIAGNHLFGMINDGQCSVIRLGDQPEHAATNRLGSGPISGRHWWQGAQPFFSGNRIFIRSYTDVYCVGDPDQPMRLSATDR